LNFDERRLLVLESLRPNTSYEEDNLDDTARQSVLLALARLETFRRHAPEDARNRMQNQHDLFALLRHGLFDGRPDAGDIFFHLRVPGLDVAGAGEPSAAGLETRGLNTRCDRLENGWAFPISRHEDDLHDGT
jgi:hypothetical protein